MSIRRRGEGRGDRWELGGGWRVGVLDGNEEEGEGRGAR